MPKEACKLTYEDISKHFRKPLVEAAEALGISPTLLKRLCRRYGVKRWPFRKMRSMDKKLLSTLNEHPQASFVLPQTSGENGSGLRQAGQQHTMANGTQEMMGMLHAKPSGNGVHSQAVDGSQGSAFNHIAFQNAWNPQAAQMNHIQQEYQSMRVPQSMYSVHHTFPTSVRSTFPNWNAYGQQQHGFSTNVQQQPQSSYANPANNSTPQHQHTQAAPSLPLMQGTREDMLRAMQQVLNGEAPLPSEDLNVQSRKMMDMSWRTQQHMSEASHHPSRTTTPNKNNASNTANCHKREADTSTFLNDIKLENTSLDSMIGVPSVTIPKSAPVENIHHFRMRHKATFDIEADFKQSAWKVLMSVKMDCPTTTPTPGEENGNDDVSEEMQQQPATTHICLDEKGTQQWLEHMWAWILHTRTIHGPELHAHAVHVPPNGDVPKPLSLLVRLSRTPKHTMKSANGDRRPTINEEDANAHSFRRITLPHKPSYTLSALKLAIVSKFHLEPLDDVESGVKLYEMDDDINDLIEIVDDEDVKLLEDGAHVHAFVQV